MITGQTGECVNDWNFEKIGQLDRFRNQLLSFLGNRFLRMQRIGVAAKRADDHSSGFYSMFKSFTLAGIIQQLVRIAMLVARIAAGSNFYSAKSFRSDMLHSFFN